MATNAPAPIVYQLMLERLVDLLDEAERIVHADGELDREQLRERITGAQEVAVALLDAG